MPNTLNFDELSLLLERAAGQLYRSSDLPDFLAWIATAGPVLAPDMASRVDPRTGPVELFFKAMGLQIYDSTPQPAHKLAIRPAAKPERNQPCYCGSGHKYKQCCQQLGMPPLPEGYNMLRHVLDHYPQKALADLPASQADLGAIANTGRQWHEEGKTRRAIALLEPWFADNRKLDKRHAPMFQLLMELYLHQHHPRKRKRLLEEVCSSQDPVLKSEGFQSHATIEVDNGNVDQAWHYFTRAQQLTPNNPDLALLEIILHCTQGNEVQAKARARFWLARLQRDPSSPQEFLDTLAQCTKDPMGTLFDATQPPGESPVLTLLALLADAPKPRVRHRLETFSEEDALEAALVPKPTLAKAEALWHQQVPSSKPSMTYLQAGNRELWDRAETWLSLLQAHPVLLDSFTVLDDLFLAVETILEQSPDAVTKPLLLLQQALLERANTLLAVQLGQHDSRKTLQLPWAIWENRPALRLLAQRACMLEALDDEPYEAYRAQLEQLLALNPNDNHGFRSELSTLCIATGNPQRAIELATAYPDDMLCPLPLNRILAMYMTGDSGKALHQLSQAADTFPVALKMLLAKSPRQPAFSEHGITLGGKDEAWLYRESTLHIWQQSGALTWLQQAMKALKG